jgi:hypothetical protein
VKPSRGKRFGVHLNAETWEVLKRLSERLELSMAATVRVAILEVADRQLMRADVESVRAEARTLFEDLQGRIDYLESRLDELSMPGSKEALYDQGAGEDDRAPVEPVAPQGSTTSVPTRAKGGRERTARRIGQGVPLAPAAEILAEERMEFVVGDEPGE